MTYRKEFTASVRSHNSTNLFLHAVLTKKRIISGSRAIVWSADHLYMSYTFELCMRKNKKYGRKKVRRKNKNKIEIFKFDFLDCEKD